MQTINRQRTGGRLLFLLIIVFILIPAFPAYTSDPAAGVALSDDKGNILYEENIDKQFIPASTLKILTSLTAFHILGTDYRFPTQYYYDKQTQNLYIKGFGDPLFISETIKEFAQKIASTLNHKTIHHIIIDHSYFSDNIKISGTGSSLNPYDATVGALCANFNTIMFKRDKTTNKFISAEPQTPLLPIFLTDIQKSGKDQDRITLSEKQSRLYPGQLIKHFLSMENIKVNGNILLGFLPEDANGIHIFKSSFTMDQIIQKLLKYSNNFIANQLLLSMGAKKYGAPATVEKGIKVIKIFLAEELGIKDLKISEGSGLSRLNRITPKQMIEILLVFKPHYYLLKSKDKEYYKTGTLNGIKTRAGYLINDNQIFYPYIIMINKRGADYASILKKLHKIIRYKKLKVDNLKNSAI